MSKLSVPFALAKQLNHCQRLFVGFSGGLDSSVLLHLLSEQSAWKPKLTAIHCHHGLSADADVWQQHCEQFCKARGILILSEKLSFDRSRNIEDHARKARYQSFLKHLGAEDALLLGHHLNDQAETLLLQLFRGAGLDGLSAMTEMTEFHHSRIIRPLLGYTRDALLAYANSHQLHWIEDASNQEEKYSRNFLRHQILPLIEEKWPNVSQRLAQTASLCQEAKHNLDALAQSDARYLPLNTRVLDLQSVMHLSRERLTNLLRYWLKKQGVLLPSLALHQRFFDELIEARADASPVLQWGKVQLRRYQTQLHLLSAETSSIFEDSTAWTDFPKPLHWHGRRILAKPCSEGGIAIPKEAKIELKCRQGGERFFFHGQHKSLKKLFQQWKVPEWQRQTTPLLFIDGQLAAVLGHAISDRFYTASGSSWRVQTD